MWSPNGAPKVHRHPPPGVFYYGLTLEAVTTFSQFAPCSCWHKPLPQPTKWPGAATDTAYTASLVWLVS